METIINTDKLLREAECNEANNQFNRAIELYETAIAQNQSNFIAYYNLGALYEKLKITNKAKSTYKLGINTARKMDNKSIEAELSYTLMGLID